MTATSVSGSIARPVDSVTVVGGLLHWPMLSTDVSRSAPHGKISMSYSDVPARSFGTGKPDSTSTSQSQWHGAPVGLGGGGGGGGGGGAWSAGGPEISTGGFVVATAESWSFASYRAPVTTPTSIGVPGGSGAPALQKKIGLEPGGSQFRPGVREVTDTIDVPGASATPRS